MKKNKTNKRYRIPNGQSRMDNSEIQAPLGSSHRMKTNLTKTKQNTTQKTKR